MRDIGSQQIDSRKKISVIIIITIIIHKKYIKKSTSIYSSNLTKNNANNFHYRVLSFEIITFSS